MHKTETTAKPMSDFESAEGPRVPNKLVLTVVKDEAPFLLEWVAYQRAIGFDSVVIYTNGCTDQTDPLCAALAREGLIEHTQFDPGASSPQGHGLWMFRKSGRPKDGDWIFFSDPDEFLNIKLGQGGVDDLIQKIGHNQGIMVPWRMFGDGGLVRYPGRSLTAAFNRSAKPINPFNRVVKTLFRWGPEVNFMSVHVPMMTDEYWQTGAPFLSPKFSALDPEDPVYAKWRAGDNIVCCTAEDTCYDQVQLNHYFVRTKACFAMKHVRGSGGANARIQGADREIRYSPKKYDESNLNDVEDTSILVNLPEVDRLIGEMLAIPEVNRIQQRIVAEFQAFESEYLRASKDA